jgi:hypothetical protein
MSTEEKQAPLQERIRVNSRNSRMRPPSSRGALKSVAASPNPKAENRKPKEARSPKSEKDFSR